MSELEQRAADPAAAPRRIVPNSLFRAPGYGEVQASNEQNMARPSASDQSTLWASLTAAELRVVALVAEGFTNGHIAQCLYLSRYTVETHLKHVFAKLRVSSRAALAAEAARRGVDVRG